MPPSSRSQRRMQCRMFRERRRADGHEVHVDRQVLADLPARVGQPGAVVEREVHRQRVQRLAVVAVVGDLAGRQHVADVALGHRAVLDLDLAGAAVGARPPAGEADDHVVDPQPRHLLRALDRGPHRALALLHRGDLAEGDAARAGVGGADHPEGALGQRPAAPRRPRRPPRARTAAPGRRPSRCRCRAPRSRRAAAPSRAAPASPAAPRRAAASCILSRMSSAFSRVEFRDRVLGQPQHRPARVAHVDDGRGRASSSCSAASSAITRRSAATGSASGSLITWSRSSTRSQRRSPIRTSPRTRVGHRPRLGQQRQRLGHLRLGAVAGDQRQVRPAQPAVHLGHPHAVLVEQLQPAGRAPDHHRHPLDRRGSPGRRSAAPGPAPARPRRALSIRSRTAPTSSSRLEAGSRTKAATRIARRGRG